MYNTWGSNMQLEIVEGKQYLSELRKYFSFHLRGRIPYQHFNGEDPDSSFDTEIHFHNINNFYSIYFFKNEGIFYFGLGREIENFVNMTPLKKIIPNLDIRLKVKNAVKFAKKDDSLYLVMPIDCESLSDKQYASLMDFVEIIEVDNQEFVNFGEIKRGIHILKNIRNFMINISLDINFTSILKLNHVPISKNLDNSQFCSKCGNFIEKSYKQEGKLKRMVGDNPTVCANCFSKKLLNYFLLNTTELYLYKENLKIISKEDGIIKFYLDLFDKFNFFDEDGCLPNSPLTDDFSPKNYILHINRAKKLQRIMDIANEMMLLSNNDVLSSFDKLLLSNNMNYSDGMNVQNQVKSCILSGKIQYKKDESILPERICVIINKVIRKMANSKVINIFTLINQLNYNTLNSFGGLNEEFSKKIKSHGLSDEICWQIRDLMINKINEGAINENNFQKNFDDITDNIIKENLENLFSKREYYCFDESIYLRTIMTYKDMLRFMVWLNSIEKFIEIINFSFFNLDAYFYKINIDFQLCDYSLNDLDSFLDELGFVKFQSIKFKDECDG